MAAMIGVILNRHTERIAHTFTPGETGRRDLVVLGHGLTSDKERPWSEGLAAELQRAGIASLRIAFSGNGESQGRFEDSNLSKEVEDLGAVLDVVCDQEGWRIGYVGHSMGAAVGVLRAARDSRIRALVSLAGMVRTGEFVERLFGHLRPGRDVMLDKPHCPLTQEFLDDLRGISSVEPQAAEVRAPWLLVHGTRDELVPVQDSLDAQKASAGHAQIWLMEEADHSFSGDGVRQMTPVVARWLVRTFAELDAAGPTT